jgi:hypothetical protein
MSTDGTVGSICSMSQAHTLAALAAGHVLLEHKQSKAQALRASCQEQQYTGLDKQLCFWNLTAPGRQATQEQLLLWE